MGRRKSEDMRGLLVRAGLAIPMLQVNMATFLGVSDRTIRRWTVGGVHLLPHQLHKLVNAVHPKDAELAGRIAAYHGRVLEDVLRPLPPERDPAADRRLVEALVARAAKVAGVAPRTMRKAIASFCEGARSSGLTTEQVSEIVGESEGR
jgi:hypothetical protein